MYQVIAKEHEFKKEKVQPFWVVKHYLKLSSAEKFLEKNKENKVYYFEIYNTLENF
jgi:hypothetical protein